MLKIKIYQIHEHEGEYNHYRDTVISTYLNLKKALQKKRELEEIEKKKREQSKKCEKCPLNFNKKNIKEAEAYCDKLELHSFWRCNNKFYGRDYVYYNIQEEYLILF